MANCLYCNSPAHVWWDCAKKPAGWRPSFKSKPTDPVEPIEVAEAAPDGKISKKPAVQAKRGRPATGFDKTAYQRELMRKRRARLKEGKAST